MKPLATRLNTAPAKQPIRVIGANVPKDTTVGWQRVYVLRILMVGLGNTLIWIVNNCRICLLDRLASRFIPVLSVRLICIYMMVSFVWILILPRRRNYG
jgi:hypothetical protein